jgi:hypothetical protein
VQVRLELTTVKVPPLPLLAVVVGRQQLAALRAAPPLPLLVSRPYVHATALHGQFDPIHRPRRKQPEEVTIQLNVAHLLALKTR